MKLCDPKFCTACRACRQVCPVNAIAFQQQLDGQCVPRIETDRCVQCGRCRQVCPALHPAALQEVQAVYAACSKNPEDLRTSASGGVASVLARKVLKNGGIVYGAAFQEGVVKHIAVTEVSQLDHLRGSKYVCSDPQDTYQEVQNHLKQDRLVLYISTPCQIAGLKSFLNRAYDQLITVDLICHGTPPFAYLRAHLDGAVGKDGWETVIFRGQHDYVLTAFQNGVSVYQEPAPYDLYFQAFMENLIFNEACYTCPYSTTKRIADITVGDFWGLDRQTLQKDYPGKISLVLVNSQRGEEWLNACQGDLTYEERSLEEATAWQENLKGPSQRPQDRDRFLTHYPQKGFDAAIRKTKLGKEVWKRQRKRKLISNPVVSQLLSIRRKWKSRRRRQGT